MHHEVMTFHIQCLESDTVINHNMSGKFNLTWGILHTSQFKVYISPGEGNCYCIAAVWGKYLRACTFFSSTKTHFLFELDLLRTKKICLQNTAWFFFNKNKHSSYYIYSNNLSVASSCNFSETVKKLLKLLQNQCGRQSHLNRYNVNINTNLCVKRESTLEFLNSLDLHHISTHTYAGIVSAFCFFFYTKSKPRCCLQRDQTLKSLGGVSS